ncbi:hypothetical protein Pa4123_01510 [Phytohabitans aurantiacus]|uniref:Thioesterase domain-containing protein n=2 Tax=Phytohabitans aurantiacus TaxID=3016789 RepID=A0ABQ5QL54_9ACTN|nr:hotdog fold thioesterase [Phytohabitans aurantiacus]GLH94879.1 hypothetical protein Pa4123_01510 [Phytohabitans aurantiacus]
MDAVTDVSPQTYPAAGALAERMGITIVEVSAERVVGTMPVDGNTQPMGLLHGGASAVLAETLGSYGAAVHGYSVGRPMAVGVELNVTHHRSARTGIVTGVAVPVHRGGTLATYEIAITDESGRRVCSGRLTCMLKSV